MSFLTQPLRLPLLNFTVCCDTCSLLQLLKCLADGLDVRGCFWWTLMDNIEWHEGFHIKFGLYRWDAEWADKYASECSVGTSGTQVALR